MGVADIAIKVLLSVVLSASIAVPAIAQDAPAGKTPAESTWPALTNSEGGHFRVELQPVEKRIPLRTFHKWLLRLETDDGKPVAGAHVQVDGGMPSHGHGLPSRPKVKPLGDGRYLIEGVQFNMGGEWEMNLGIKASVVDLATLRFMVNY